MNLTHTVTPSLLDNGDIKIETTAHFEGLDKLLGREYTAVTTQLVRMQDEAIRRGLMALGWIPPLDGVDRAPAVPNPDYGTQMATLLPVIRRVDANVLHDALKMRGWRHNGRAYWWSPE